MYLSYSFQTWSHQLENELLSLNPNDFSCIRDYLSKYKTLRLVCAECKIKKEDKQCIYHILSKLGPAYSVFVSAFYSMKESLIAASLALNHFVIL